MPERLLAKVFLGTKAKFSLECAVCDFHPTSAPESGNERNSELFHLGPKSTQLQIKFSTDQTLYSRHFESPQTRKGKSKSCEQKTILFTHATKNMKRD